MIPYTQHLSVRDLVKLNNYKSADDKLKKLGIKYELKNLGKQWVISGENVTADLWPARMKWNIRQVKRGQGLENMIDECTRRNLILIKR